MGLRRHSGFDRTQASILSAFAIVLALSGSIVLSGRAVASHDEYEAGCVQVQLKAPHTIDEVNAVFGTTVLDSLPPLYYLQVPSGHDDESMIQEMEEHNEYFEFVEHSWNNETPEGTRQMVVAAVGGTIEGFRDQGLVHRLHIDEANVNVTGEGVVVAVLDGGVKADHEGLGGKVLSDGFDFIDNDGDPSDSANGVDEDLDGLVDEGAGHGTMVSGIIHLVAPGVSILPVRVLDDEGHGTTFSVAKGIRYAVEHGAKVINLSLGLTQSSRVIGYEIEQARLASVALAAAAGNSGADSLILYPASDPRVLMVAGLDSADVKAPFSSYHPDVAVSAPSLGIYSPYYDGGYAIGAGTSFATPFISAECALVLALDPCLNVDQVYQRIGQGVVDVYSIPENAPYTGALGTGRFDALEMLQISPITAGLPEAGPVVAALRLAPNPVHTGDALAVSWSSVVPGPARLLIHDASGRQLRVFRANESQGADLVAQGDDGRPLPPGAYFVRLQTPAGTASAKLIVLR